MSLNNNEDDKGEAKVARACLKFKNQTYTIFEGQNTIGRNPEAVINIKNLGISQNQAIITIVNENSHYISDLKSSNGTFLCDRKLIPLKLYKLNDGVSIKFANIFCTYKKFNNEIIDLTDHQSEAPEGWNQSSYRADTQQIVSQSNSDNVQSIHEDSTQLMNATINSHEAPTQIMSLTSVAETSTQVSIHDLPTQVSNYGDEEKGVDPIVNDGNDSDQTTVSHHLEQSSRTDVGANADDIPISNYEERVVDHIDDDDSDSDQTIASQSLLKEETQHLEPSSRSDAGANADDEDSHDSLNFFSNPLHSPLKSSEGTVTYSLPHQDLPSENETSTSSQIQPVKISKSNPLNESDNDTKSPPDIELSQIHPVKIGRKKIVDLDSDSEDEIEELDRSEQQKSTSEQQKSKYILSDSDSETDAEEPKTHDLTNDKIIPATQDEMNMSHKIIGNSSLESFRLELSTISMETEELSRSKNDVRDTTLQEDKTVESAKVAETQKNQDEENSDEINVGEDASKCEEVKSHKNHLDIQLTASKKNLNEDKGNKSEECEVNASLDSTQTLEGFTESEKTTDGRPLNDQDKDDNIYLLPTQSMDFFSQVTDTADSLFKKPTLGIVGNSKNENIEDIYLQPTQTLDTPSGSNQSDSFLQPSDKFLPSSFKKKNCDIDMDFLPPTQALAFLTGVDEETDAEKVEEHLQEIFATQSNEFQATQQLVDVLEAAPTSELQDNSGFFDDIIDDSINEDNCLTLSKTLLKTSASGERSNDKIENNLTGEISASESSRQQVNEKEDKNYKSGSEKTPKTTTEETSQKGTNKNENKEKELSHDNSKMLSLRRANRLNSPETSKHVNKIECKPSTSKVLDSVNKKSKEIEVETVSKTSRTRNRIQKIESSVPEKENEQARKRDATPVPSAVTVRSKTRSLKNLDNEVTPTIKSDNKNKAQEEKRPKTRAASKVGDLAKTKGEDREQDMATRTRRAASRMKEVDDQSSHKNKPQTQTHSPSGNPKTKNDSENHEERSTRAKRGASKIRDLDDKPSKTKTPRIESDDQSSDELPRTRRGASKTRVLSDKSKKNTGTSSQETPQPPVHNSKKRVISSSELPKKTPDDTLQRSTRSKRNAEVVTTPLTSSEVPEKRTRRNNIESKDEVVSASSSSTVVKEPVKKIRRLSANSRHIRNEEERKNTTEVHSPSILSTPERSRRKVKPKVVFTMMDDPTLESLIRQLGGSVVDSVDACTVLVTESVKRTQKLLCAVGQSKPICSSNWLKNSRKASAFLDPWDYILVDKEAEKKWDFSLKQSLKKSSQWRLFENYTFQIMTDTAVDVLKGAIESCGGKCVNKNLPKATTDNLVIVSTPENKSKFSKITKQNKKIIVVEPEAVFDGVLRQELRFDRHLLT